MKLGWFALPAVFLLAVSVLMGACSDSSDSLTLGEHFAEFEAIDADIDAQFEALYADFPEVDSEEELFADEANLSLFKELVAGFPRITGDSLDRVKRLDPPSEVEETHSDLVNALEDLLAVFVEGAGILDEAETMAEFASLMIELEDGINAATTRFDTACLAVVAAGEANGLTVDVTCEDD